MWYIQNFSLKTLGKKSPLIFKFNSEKKGTNRWNSHRWMRKGSMVGFLEHLSDGYLQLKKLVYHVDEEWENLLCGGTKVKLQLFWWGNINKHKMHKFWIIYLKPFSSSQCVSAKLKKYVIIWKHFMLLAQNSIICKSHVYLFNSLSLVNTHSRHASLWNHQVLVKQCMQWNNWPKITLKYCNEITKHCHTTSWKPPDLIELQKNCMFCIHFLLKEILYIILDFKRFGFSKTYFPCWSVKCISETCKFIPAKNTQTTQISLLFQ